MTGCRHGAKNTLVKNYLHLAERAGAIVHPETTVLAVRPRRGGGYSVDTVRTGPWWQKTVRRRFVADQVVFAAGAWGTQKLLHRMKVEGILPGLSDRLGELTRTNSEALGGATGRRGARRRPQPDFTQGVAITSSFHPNERTHIEPVRYGKGSNAMGLLGTVATRGGGRTPRWIGWLAQIARRPWDVVAMYAGLRHWSERSVIALVMQTHDNSLTVEPGRTVLGRFRLRSGQGHGEPNPTWIPEADTAIRHMADEIDGIPANSIGEIVDIPMTAHFIGGCPIGDSRETGVVDPYHRLYGYSGLHVVDGSAISANLGVNPALTITAQAERAMAMWPNRGDHDPRPSLGAGYERIDPVAPNHPLVPDHAPAALRLPDFPARPRSQHVTK